MALIRTLKISRVGLIEAISITAGIATLFSAAQNLAQNNPRIAQSKVGHAFGLKDPRRFDRPSDIKDVMAYAPPGDAANLSDQQFSAMVYQETAFAKDLPPLINQLQADALALQQLRSDEKNAQNTPLIKTAKGVVLHDKEAIMQLMLQNRLQLHEIIWPNQKPRFIQVRVSGS
jgi:hypothetical protein